MENQNKKDEKQNQNSNNEENEDFEDFLEGNYVSLKDDETRDLEFRTRGEIVVKPGYKGGPPVEKASWKVSKPGILREKTFELSVTHARKVYDVLQQGYTVVRITRTGAGYDTTYTVKGIS
jgi:hypothetical protein